MSETATPVVDDEAIAIVDDQQEPKAEHENVSGVDPLALAGSLLLTAHRTLSQRTGPSNNVDRAIALGQALGTFALADATRRLNETLEQQQAETLPQRHMTGPGLVVPMAVPAARR